MKHRSPIRRVLREELLECVIDDALSRSKKLVKLTRAVSAAQRRLRAVADDRAWQAYLEVERAANMRARKELRVLLLRMLVFTATRL